MTPLDPKFYSSIVTSAEQALFTMRKNNLLGKDRGVFVSIYEPSRLSKISTLTFLVGSIPDFEAEKYREYSIRKPKFAHNGKRDNPYLKDWGGGFYLEEEGFGIGVAGLIEHRNMVFALLIALLCNIITREEAEEILESCFEKEISDMLYTALRNP